MTTLDLLLEGSYNCLLLYDNAIILRVINYLH